MLSRTFRFLAFLSLSIALAGSALLLGCSADDAAGLDADGDTGFPGVSDGGVSGDSAAADAGPRRDAAMDPAPPPGAEGLWLGEARGNEFRSDASGDDATSCFDGVDNDTADNLLADGIDCNDPECQDLPSCCANEAACVSTATSVVDTDYNTCADALCGENFEFFGGPDRPVIDSGSLALQGDSFFDSGLFGLDELNLRDQRIDIEVQFRLGVCEGCVETAAVALTAQETLTDTMFVQPLVGLRALAPVNQVQLIIHDRVVATYDAGDQSVPWKLSVRPDGDVQVTHGDISEHEEYVPRAGAHLALYGHSSNPGEHDGARIVGLHVDRFATDRVDAWSPARSLDLSAGRVSVARHAGVDYLAVNDTAESGPHSVRFYRASDGSLANWVFQSDWEAEDYSIAVIEGVIYVYAINSVRQWVRAAVDVDTLVVGEPVVDLIPGDLDWGSFANPTVTGADGLRVVVAEVDGALEAAFHNGGAWASLRSLGSLTEGAREPSLVTHDNVYWLHYSVQRGTRQRIRAMVSDQMVHWRDLGDALAGSGLRDSVDRFSVATPALVSDGDSLRMYMSADDHVMRRVAVVERFSPVGRTR